MSRAVVDNPEDATGIVVGRSCHDLLNQSIKGCNAILGFATAEDPGVVHVERGDVSPSAAAKILVFDVHGRTGSAVLGGMFAAAGLNAGLLIGGDDELILLEGTALPLARIQVQHATGLGSEIWIARKYPTAVIPRPNRIFMEPSPQSAATHRRDQATLLNLLN